MMERLAVWRRRHSTSQRPERGWWPRLRRRPRKGPSRYWERRRDYEYYREVTRLARKYEPAGGAVLDVGAGETQVVHGLKWFKRKVALDVRYRSRKKRGVKTLLIDFKDYEPEARFDLVLCLQVLEHLDQPAPFAGKLFETGRRVIISVPYRWPQSGYGSHVQDPVDEAKLESWTGRAPIESTIVTDKGMPRLISVYARSEALDG